MPVITVGSPRISKIIEVIRKVLKLENQTVLIIHRETTEGSVHWSIGTHTENCTQLKSTFCNWIISLNNLTPFVCRSANFGSWQLPTKFTEWILWTNFIHVSKRHPFEIWPLIFNWWLSLHNIIMFDIRNLTFVCISQNK